MNLSQLTQARWFPTVSKPLLSGLLASGVVFGLHALGVTHFTSNEANSAITPLAGFIVAAIVDKGKGDPEPETGDSPTLGHDLAQVLLPDIEDAINANPGLLRGTLLQALLAAEQTTAPPPTVALSPPQRTDQGLPANDPGAQGFVR